MEDVAGFWSLSLNEIQKRLGTSLNGLTSEEVQQRRAANGAVKQGHALSNSVRLFLRQFKSPLVLLLLLGLVLSTILSDFFNSAIIFVILLLSGTLSFWQERKANRAAAELQQLVQTKCSVKRNGIVEETPIDDVVPGDVIFLSAGDIIPADAIVVQSKDLYVNESSLTGESFPAEKSAGVLPLDTPLLKRRNTLFKSTNVVSGTATIIAVETGTMTEFGQIRKVLEGAEEDTAFEKSINAFGYMLMRIALIMSGVILVINISAGKPAFDSILFALALSLGLTPELLPAIVTITLSAGAKRMLGKKVIVKKLASIQNFGSLDILCSDKTGTLTEGVVSVHSYISADGVADEGVRKFAYLNASFESGYVNPIDEAIRTNGRCDIEGYEKLDEIPFDFIRKRLSILVSKEGVRTLISKGAVSHIMDVCSKARLSSGIADVVSCKEGIGQRFRALTGDGYRVVAVAYKEIDDDRLISKDDESEMTFLGFVTLYDPLKENIVSIIGNLNRANIRLKVITGDNLQVAQNIAKRVGIAAERIMSGPEISKLSDAALTTKVEDIDVFAETEPAHKERIVKALQRLGHVIGYLGDGINDAAALKAADVGISVSNAVDVARESADMILLDKDLNVVLEGALEGRKTFLNTLKYIFIAVSANFGNMFSMAAASVVLPFLPLLPYQVLLTNLLTDFPALSIASDNVDDELLQTPRKWKSDMIRKFMIIFGLESSLFDFITFGTLIFVLHASTDTFRTGWFIESVISAIIVLLIIRTRRTFFKSIPGRYMLISSIVVILVVLAIPYLPLASKMHFARLSASGVCIILSIVIAYAAFAEWTKKIVFKKIGSY